MKANKYFIRENCPFIYFGDNVSLTQNFVEQALKHSAHAGALCLMNYGIEELPNNLGINGTLYIRKENFLSHFISKCVTCDLKSLIFGWCINEKVTYDDFKFLTSSGLLEKLCLGKTIITSNNGEIIPYETLLEHTPALRFLYLEYNNYLKLSHKFIDKICASNLEVLKVCQLPENFERDAILAYLAKKKPNLRARLFFLKH
uniref:Uncharacterized protein n=1 Tax=Panagrolaimus sp. PS1159 TaxID=55785 RepID=A0AC35GCT7_9BILA